MYNMHHIEPQPVTPAPAVDLAAVFSDKLQDLTDSLAVLFIRNNAGGRNNFRKKWPQVARYIFGAELIACDDNGTDDHGRREKLEYEAGERRIAIKLTIAELYDKTVEKGILQSGYVGQIIDEYGPDIAQLFYAPDIIERVRPGLLSCAKPQDEAGEEEKLSAAERTVLHNIPEDPPKEAQPPPPHGPAVRPGICKALFNAVSRG